MGRVEKRPAVLIHDSQKARYLALHSIIQDFHIDNSDAQMNFDLLLRARSQKQSRQFEKAVDTLLAVDLL